MKLILLAAAAVLLSGCGTTALDNLTRNQACTTRVSGKLAFGSITPTGTLNVSAVCKPGEVPTATVAAPPAEEPTPALPPAAPVAAEGGGASVPRAG